MSSSFTNLPNFGATAGEVQDLVDDTIAAHEAAVNPHPTYTTAAELATALVPLSGDTASRPGGTPVAGFFYFDTDLSQPIWALGDGSWVDATGTPV